MYSLMTNERQLIGMRTTQSISQTLLLLQDKYMKYMSCNMRFLLGSLALQDDVASIMSWLL